MRRGVGVRWWGVVLPQAGIGVALFLKAEDAIREVAVTGVQTCALPILPGDPLEVQGAQVRVGLPVGPDQDGDVPVAGAAGGDPLRDEAGHPAPPPPPPP